MLNYHALKQDESKSGAEFVNRELREYMALRDMGVQIDDSIRLTKFIQQDTTNTKHKHLAQAIFTEPNMTLGRAASLLRLIIRQLQRSTRSLAVTAKEKTTNYQIVPRNS